MIKEWLITADIQQSNVTVIVTAATEEEAKQKFDAMEWDSEDRSAASTDNWAIEKIEEND